MNDEIAEKLRHKGLSESSIKLYLSTLRKLNWGQPIENLNYLRKTDEIVKRMDHLADSTRKQMLISVISVLSLFPKFKNVQQKYYKLIQEWNKAMDTPSTTATETQRKNWIDWEQVLQEFENLRQHALSLEKAKKGTLTAPQYAGLLQAALLGLYVLVPPRRNMDYQQMVVGTPTDDNTKNYYDPKGKTFTFNMYKTSKTHGKTVENVPEQLVKILKIYLKHNPLATKDGTAFPLLVFGNGQAFDSSNSITRILNRIFGKHFGSSMLRHSYLSNKYGKIEQDREKDAQAMGHTVNTQREYIKVL
jgi:integrase